MSWSDDAEEEEEVEEAVVGACYHRGRVSVADGVVENDATTPRDKRQRGRPADG